MVATPLESQGSSHQPDLGVTGGPNLDPAQAVANLAPLPVFGDSGSSPCVCVCARACIYAQVRARARVRVYRQGGRCGGGWRRPGPWPRPPAGHGLQRLEGSLQPDRLGLGPERGGRSSVPRAAAATVTAGVVTITVTVTVTVRDRGTPTGSGSYPDGQPEGHCHSVH